MIQGQRLGFIGGFHASGIIVPMKLRAFGKRDLVVCRYALPTGLSRLSGAFGGRSSRLSSDFDYNGGLEGWFLAGTFPRQVMSPRILCLLRPGVTVPGRDLVVFLKLLAGLSRFSGSFGGLSRLRTSDSDSD